MKPDIWDRIALLGLTFAFFGIIFFVICMFAGVQNILIALPMVLGIIIELGAMIVSEWVRK